MTSWGRRVAFCCFMVASWLWAFGASAAYVPPPIAGHVTDTAGRLTPGEVASLNDKLATYRACSSNHIAVFLPKSLEGSSIEDVAYSAFNTWKIGEGTKDNGVLLVLATNERRVRIETGKGVGGDLTDVDAAHILRDDVNPNLKENRFFAAADLATTSIARKLGGCSVTNASPAVSSRPAGAWTATPASSLWYRIPFTLAIALLVVFAFVAQNENRSGIVGGVVTAFAFYGLVSLVARGDDGLDDMSLILILGVVGLSVSFVVCLISWLIARDEKKKKRGGGDSGSSYSSSDSSSSDYSSSSGGSSSSSDYSGGGGSSGGGGASDSY